MRIEVVELDVTRRADRARFVGLPFELARAHKAWQPGLRLYAATLIDPRRNPFWRSRLAAYFIVVRRRRVVARAGIIAPGSIPQQPTAATLVMPDFVDDAAAVHGLFDAVRARARALGASELVGPLNPDIHHDVGVQIDGFERRNAIFMGYQPSYYARHFDALGFERLLDFQAWSVDAARDAEDPRLGELATRSTRHGQLRIRSADPARFDEELVHFHQLYSASFADHWGFVPPSWEEFRFIAGDLRYILRRGMALLAEWQGAPVGFVLTIPDAYAILPKRSRGRLTPLFAARTLLRWRSIADARIMIAGVLPEYRRYGVHLALFHRLRRSLVALGFRRAEISWVLQQNRAMQRALPLLGARPVKTYRLYTARIDA